MIFHEPFLHRDDDTFGIGMGFAQVSGQAAGLDQDTQLYTGTFTPKRSSETFVEVTYQYAVAPWLMLQPDFQYVFNPGGGVANAAGTARVQDEAVIGVRTNILF
jgi:porin